MKTTKVFILAFTLLFQSMAMAKTQENAIEDLKIKQNDVQAIITSILDIMNVQLSQEEEKVREHKFDQAEDGLIKSLRSLYDADLNQEQVAKITEVSIYTLLLSEEFKVLKDQMTDDQLETLRVLISDAVFLANPKNQTLKEVIRNNAISAVLFTFLIFSIGVMKGSKSMIIYGTLTAGVLGTVTTYHLANVKMTQIQETYNKLNLTLSDEAAEYFLNIENNSNLNDLN
jgi:hypothetical protein